MINGTIDSWNQCTNGDQTECYATDNFWRSISNLTINVTGLTGCYAGDDFWAVSQAAPMRRVQINGNLTLMDYCDGSPDWASGGFIADSEFNGTVTNGSQQQYFTRNSDIDGWSNGVWNQVFCGDPGAPAQSFGSNSGDSGGPEPYTTLGHLPDDPGGALPLHGLLGQLQRVRPLGADQLQRPDLGQRQHPRHLAARSRARSTSSTPSSTIAQINAALAAGDNLLFTPGVYSYASTINVTKPTRRSSGSGFATLIPTAATSR